MDVTEIKQEINQIIDFLPKDKLPEALALIKKFREETFRELIEKIIEEDKELFKRLSE